jgi:hypothetical protein
MARDMARDVARDMAKDIIRYAAAVLACLLLLGAGYAAAEPLSVETSTDRRAIAIGDTVSLILDLTWESGVEPRPVATRENLGDFIVRDIRQGPVVPAEGGFARRVSVLLTVFEVGEHTVPSIPILFKGADGKAGRIETEPVDIVVESVLAGDSTEVRDIKPPLSVKKRWKEIILSYALLIGLASAAATSVLVSVRKKSEIEVLARKIWLKITRPIMAFVAWLLTLIGLKEKPEPETYDIEVAEPYIDPVEAAYTELARIEALGLIEKGLIDDLYTLVSEVLRRYIERKYGVLAMELPTSYILRAIAARGVMAVCYGEVRDVLEECDLVKFATYIPPDESVASIIGRAREIVRATSAASTPRVDLEA